MKQKTSTEIRKRQCALLFPKCALLFFKCKPHLHQVRAAFLKKQGAFLEVEVPFHHGLLGGHRIKFLVW